MKQLKLFQYDKKVWDDGDTNHTWQFGIVNNRSFLWVNYQNPNSYFGDGIRAMFISSSVSLFAVEFQIKYFSLSFHFFTEYFEGWDT